MHALWRFLLDSQLCLTVCAGPGGILAGAEKLALTTALAGFVVLGSQVHRTLTCFPPACRGLMGRQGLGRLPEGGGVRLHTSDCCSVIYEKHQYYHKWEVLPGREGCVWQAGERIYVEVIVQQYHHYNYY